MKLLFAPDICFKNFDDYDGQKAYSCMGETAKIFENSDFSIINLENPFGNRDELTPLTKSGPNIISIEDFAGYLDILKPTVVGLANNHTGDFGDGPVIDTIDFLEKKGYYVIGAGKTIDDAYKPARLELDGVKVSVIAVCENEFGVAENDKPGVAGYRLSKVAHSIRNEAEEGYLPIIFFHGGNEGNPFPSPGKVELYRHFGDLGAKAVIAMHTHCPQGYEVYNGCPIVYSMGNFFFPYPTEKAPAWSHGYMTELEISKNDFKMNIIPYKFSYEKHTLLTGEEKAHFIKYIDYLNRPIGDDDLLKKYFDAWCIMDGIGGYSGFVNFTLTMVENGATEASGLKNIFSCEAHNELITNTMKIIYDGRCKKAEEKIEEIRKLQNMEIPAEN